MWQINFAILVNGMHMLYSGQMYSRPILLAYQSEKSYSVSGVGAQSLQASVSLLTYCLISLVHIICACNMCYSADPLAGGAGRPKFNQLEMNLYLQTQFGEDRCTQFRVIMVADPQTNTQTDRGNYNTLRRSFASAQCNYWQGWI